MGLKEYDIPMFTAHKSIGKSSENLLGCASEVFFGFSILLLAVNMGIYHTKKCYPVDYLKQKSPRLRWSPRPQTSREGPRTNKKDYNRGD